MSAIAEGKRCIRPPWVTRKKNGLKLDDESDDVFIVLCDYVSVVVTTLHIFNTGLSIINPTKAYPSLKVI